MILSSVPANCWRVMHHALRHVARGFTHGPFRHSRVVPKRHHAALAHHAHHPIVHAPVWHSWTTLVCVGAGAGMAGVGAAGGGYAAGRAAQAIYAPPPAQIAQAVPPQGLGVPGYGEGGPGGLLYPPYYGTGAAIAPTALPSPESVVLQPVVPTAPPPVIVITQQLPPAPRAVAEPASALLLLTFGVIGAVAIVAQQKVHQ